MAIHGAIPSTHEVIFPAGAYVVGEVEAIDDYDAKQAGVEDCQQRDKTTGLRVWAVRVVDVDPRGPAGPGGGGGEGIGGGAAGAAADAAGDAVPAGGVRGADGDAVGR